MGASERLMAPGATDPILSSFVRTSISHLRTIGGLLVVAGATTFLAACGSSAETLPLEAAPSATDVELVFVQADATN